MKGPKQQSSQQDPWRDLANAGTVTSVALEEVFANLHISGRQASTVKKGLLDELTRLADAAEGKKKR